MKVIFNEENTKENKVRHETMTECALENIKNETRLLFMQTVGLVIPLATIAALAVSYATQAYNDNLKLDTLIVRCICILLNLIIPTYQIIKTWREYCCFKDTEPDELQELGSPADVLYYNALQNGTFVDIETQSSETPDSLDAYLILETSKGEKRRILGTFPIQRQNNISEPTLDLEKQTIFMPFDELNSSEG